MFRRKAMLTTLALAAMALAACSDKEGTTPAIETGGEIQTTVEEKSSSTKRAQK